MSGIARYIEVLSGIVRYCQVLSGIVKCKVLLESVRHCQVMNVKNTVSTVKSSYFIFSNLISSD